MKKVLLVDDDEIANYLHGLILRQLKYFDEVETCLNGKAALAVLDKLRDEGKGVPQLILLDINMPVMNGFEFLDEFEKLPESFTRDIRIIVLTSSVNEKEKERATAYKTVAEVCNKPLTIDTMSAIITRLFPAP